MYNIHEIFYSLQGEGANAGKPVVFVRFAGCNLNCSWCDTPKVKGTKMTAEQIFTAVITASPLCHSIIFTGGEPLLQIDNELIDTFLRYWKGVETNGTLPVPSGFDWITISPKGSIHEANRRLKIDELRYPIKHNDKCPPIEHNAFHRYLSPIFNGNKPVKRNIDWAIMLCLMNPRFKLSVQQHKLWRIK